MDDAVRAQLRHIVTTYGPQVSDDPRRIGGLLRDLSGEHRAEIAVLVGAASEGVPSELLALKEGMPPAVLADRLSRMLQDHLGLADHSARWAVSAWAWALGVTGIESPAPASISQPTTPHRAEAVTVDAPEPATVVVGQLGAAHHRTITAAIKSAEPGTRILVRPGLYREALVIDKPLELLADGPVDDVTIEATDGNCIKMQADMAIVRGFSLHGRAGEKGNKFFTVSVPQGRLILESCDISSDSLACVGIKTGGKPTIRDCRIHDSANGAIFCHERGAGLVEGCDMYANSTAAVEVATDSSLTVRQCVIREGKSSGLYFRDNAAGTVEDCEIWGSASAGVSIKGGGSPTIRRCRIRDGQSCGVLVYEQGGGVVEDCEIWGNKLSGVEIRTGGNPTVRRCEIRDGEMNGVYVYEQGGGVAEDCEIRGNKYSGVAIKTGGNPTIRQCRIQDQQACGVLVYEQGGGVVEDCEIRGNKYSGVEIRTGGNPTVRRCEIRDGHSHGVFAHDQGAGTVEDCGFRGNALAAVNVTEDSLVQVDNCRIEESAAR